MGIELLGEPPPERGFLTDLDEGRRASLEARGLRQSFPAGVALFHEKQVADKVIGILTGRVKISTISERGRESVLGFCGPGTLLGDISAIDGEPRSASAITLEPVEGLIVSNERFMSWLEGDSQAAVQLLSSFARRQRRADQKRADFGAADVVGRLAAALVELERRWGREAEDGIVIDLPVSQEELAGWIGASREAVAKSMRTLRDCGWIATGRRTVTVLDGEALRRRGA